MTHPAETDFRYQQNPRAGSGSVQRAERTFTWIADIDPGVRSDSVARDVVASVDARLLFIYRHVRNGFAFQGSEQAAAAVADAGPVIRVRRTRSSRNGTPRESDVPKSHTQFLSVPVESSERVAS
ncbi:MAG: hypothetical protein M3092_08400 [Actinomycetia bacterium]|nr:hypothetical protein [Actinomycetes bacterium]